MDAALIQVFAIYGFMVVITLTIACIVLARNPKNRINRNFFLFYFFTALGLIINIAYRALNDPVLNPWMNRGTVFFTMFGIVFLLIFNIIINKSQTIFTHGRAVLYVILWAIACSGVFWIDYFTGYNGVQWDYGPDTPGLQDDPIIGGTGIPVWSTMFTLYAIILAQGLFVITLIVVFKIYRKFSDKKLKRKYISSIIAIIFFDWIMVGGFLNNWQLIQDNTPGFSTVFFYSSALVLPAVVLLWLGTRRQQQPKVER